MGDALSLRPAIRVAACAGAQVRVEPDLKALSASVEAPQPQVVLFESALAERSDLDQVRSVHSLYPDAHFILLTDPSPPAQMEAFLTEPWTRHLIGRSPWFMDELTATLAKLGSASIFGLDRALPWGAKINEICVDGSASKHAVFEKIESFLANLGIRGRGVARIVDIADEMLMNAVYDAPIDPRTQKARYAHLDRKESVDLEPSERPIFRFGSDGQRLVLGISDPFGGLSPAILKRYLAKGLRGGTDQIDSKAGGAGLGLFLMYQGLNSLCLNVKAGRHTELIGVMNIRGSYRDVRQTPKSITIFEA